MLIKKLCVITAIVAILVSNSAFSNTNGEEHKDEYSEWTVICYLAGDNFLDWFMKQNLIELEKTGGNDRVNVIAFLDTTDDETKMFEVYKDDLVRIPTRIVNYAWSNSELNTGNPSTLVDFASWTIKKYPAKKYFLILGGYGEGWIGLMHDMNNGQGDTDVLSLRELKDALEKIVINIKDVNGKDKIDVLGLDACYMGMLEVMYEIKDCARFLISSENEEALDGWPYDRLLETIINNPETNASQLTSSTVDTYLDSVKGGPTKMSNVLTLSVVDLELMDELVEGMNTLSLLLLKLQKEKPGKITFAERVTNKFLISAHIAGKYVPYSVLIDLKDFIDNIRISSVHNKEVSDLTKRLSVLLEKAVVKERHQALKGEYNLGISGISLYFAGMDTTSYKQNDFSRDTHWDEFITERSSMGQSKKKRD